VSRFAVAFIVGLSVLVPGNAVAFPEREGRHCAYELVPIGQRGRVTTTRVEKIGCFGTFAEALVAGSHGAIAPPDGLAPDRLTDALLKRITDPQKRGLELVGTEYRSTNFDGTAENYFGNNTCQNGNIVEAANLPAGEDDQFESGKGFGGCDTNKKFAGPWFGGDVETCTPNCSTYGPLRNEVSSLRWRP
jgi:hypothetical protein